MSEMSPASGINCKLVTQIRLFLYLDVQQINKRSATQIEPFKNRANEYMFSISAAPLFLSNENVIQTSNVFFLQKSHNIKATICWMSFIVSWCFVLFFFIPFLNFFIFSTVEIVYITRLILHMIIILANGWSLKNEIKLNETKCIIIEHRKTICINTHMRISCLFTVDEFPIVCSTWKKK